MTDVMPEATLFELLSLEYRVDSYGNMTYHNSDGQLHRVYGPAVVYSNGGREWYQNGQRHRMDGPAVERVDGSRAWFRNGQRHRIDGPSIEYSDGYRAWHINGYGLTEAEWQRAVASMENV